MKRVAAAIAVAGISVIGAACSRDEVAEVSELSDDASAPAREAAAVGEARTAAPTLASAAPVAPPASAACGDKPLPPCPLAAWMKANAAPAIVGQDFDALAVVLAKIAGFAPADYPNWASIADDGSHAAQVQSLDAVKAACRSCHTQYRERYKRERRDRAL
jgi:hypothetical protein